LHQPKISDSNALRFENDIGWLDKSVTSRSVKLLESPDKLEHPWADFMKFKSLTGALPKARHLFKTQTRYKSTPSQQTFLVSDGDNSENIRGIVSSQATEGIHKFLAFQIISEQRRAHGLERNIETGFTFNGSVDYTECTTAEQVRNLIAITDPVIDSIGSIITDSGCAFSAEF